MHDASVNRLLRRLGNDTLEQKQQTTSIANIYVEFIAKARQKGLSWGKISNWIAEETGDHMSDVALRVWWHRRNRVQRKHKDRGSSP